MYKIISPNMLKTYQSCPKKYYLRYVEGINVPQNVEKFERGKNIHAMANYKLRGVNISRLEVALTPDEAALWSQLQENEYYQKTYFNSEFNLTIKLDKYWLGGRLDAMTYENGKYYILDYKTGSAPQKPQDDVQTMVYMLCADRYLKNYDELNFVYIDLKNNRNAIVKFDTELKKSYEKYLVSLCEKIEQDTLFEEICTNCMHCEYKNICK